MSKDFEVVCVNTGAIEENGWPGKSWRVSARNEDEACDKVLENLDSWGEMRTKATLPRRQDLQAYRVS